MSDAKLAGTDESEAGGQDDDIEEVEHDDDPGDADGDTQDTEDGSDVTGGQIHVGRKPLNGPPCSLKTLVNDGILEPGQGLLTIDYMGAKFIGDLLPNGNIRWQENKQTFTSPSAWVNHCKKLINPENKSGSAWSTIRYQGKRLDSYKLRWYRKQKKIATNNKSSDGNDFLSAASISKSLDPTFAESILALQQKMIEERSTSRVLKDKNVMEHSELGLRSQDKDMNTMVRCTPFSALDRIQPFTITLSTNALLLIDFHCHLTKGEVVGYLAGKWDVATHNLAILQSFPCRSRLQDTENAALVEEEIRQALERRNLTLVGWYHSHPNATSEPTIKDIESQMEYQIAMKGESDSSYTPCIGLICSPFDECTGDVTTSYQVYWVMPPPEYKPQEYGKPMQMAYSIARDAFLTQDLLLEMRLLAHFYAGAPDFILFKEVCKSSGSSFWDLLQASLKPKLPRDLQVAEGQSVSQSQVQQQALSHFWAFVKGLLMP